ncbi:hypothetical protein AGLY_016130 [Aphis glycines]|uniref:Uncharacterized protein n=1 Tax=Aphis glycines TaxID=307491 RepID=A0A6G0SZK1_APHGL|nr:hypothetical protein AGLY_016130 [Aphis glycines]
MVASELDDNVLLARSAAVLNRLNALGLECMSFFRLSKSSPPKCVSPAVDLTSNIEPSSICRTDTSNVPPPRSNINTFLSPFKFLSRPYAKAAAVGSLIIRITFRPAMTPASFVACLCESLKYAGTVITASVTLRPKYASAVSFIFVNTIELISSGAKTFRSPLNSTWILGFPQSFTTLNGQCLMSACVFSSSKRRPIKRLASNTVFTGFIATWFLAASPINRSVSVNAT